MNANQRHRPLAARTGKVTVDASELSACLSGAALVPAGALSVGVTVIAAALPLSGTAALSGRPLRSWSFQRTSLPPRSSAHAAFSRHHAGAQ